MRKSALSVAIDDSLTGWSPRSAAPVEPNPDVFGQVLIYPYYTMGGAESMPPRDGPVKVRFLEGYNSREVRDFNLYLSPHDVWTAKEPPR
jgi:hypothetical protein